VTIATLPARASRMMARMAFGGGAACGPRVP